MAEGTIKRITDKGFGFIDTGTNQDMFFHSSNVEGCLLYTSPSPRDATLSRMPSSA